MLFDRFAGAVVREDDHTAAVLNRELARNRDQLAKLLGAYAPERQEVDVNVRRSAAATIDRAEAELWALTADRQPETIDAEVMP